MPTKVHPKQLKQGGASVGQTLVWDGANWVPGGGVGTVYLRGDANTNGSVRLASLTDYTAVLQTRLNGTWVDLTVFD